MLTTNKLDGRVCGDKSFYFMLMFHALFLSASRLKNVRIFYYKALKLFLS
jgi:hypothetical protein